jgi:predicted phosphodiesterase
MIGVSRNKIRTVIACAQYANEPIPGFENNSISDSTLEWLKGKCQCAKDVAPTHLHATTTASDNDKVDGDSVHGLTPNDIYPDANDVWKQALQIGDKANDRSIAREGQYINISDNKPIVILHTADWHLGSNSVFYRELKNTIELVRDCPFAYAILYGDLHENSITPKVQHLAWNQHLSMREELSLMRWCFEELAKTESLLSAVGGNHDGNRTYLACGLDIVALLLRDIPMLYDPHEIIFTLRMQGEDVLRFAMRHSWKGRSKVNPTYGIEDYIRFNGDLFDVAVAGHTHNMSVQREFVYGGKVKAAIQLASYKVDDSFPRQLGVPRCPNGHMGSYAQVVYPDGSFVGIRDVDKAIRFCASERQ